jgi:hypothetical protein
MICNESCNEFKFAKFEALRPTFNLKLIISAMRAWIALDSAKQFKIFGPSSRLKQ